MWIWVTSTLTIYLTLIAVFNRPDKNSADFASASRQYWITIAVEVLIIIAVGYFLKKRYELAKRREELSQQYKEMKEFNKEEGNTGDAE